MMPSTTPAAGEAAAASRGHGYGFVLVAFILVFVTGCFNMIEGIAAIANSRVFIAHAHFIFANLTLVFALRRPGLASPRAEHERPLAPGRFGPPDEHSGFAHVCWVKRCKRRATRSGQGGLRPAASGGRI